MQVVDRVDTQGRVEKLTEKQRDDLFTKMILGKDVVEETETSRGIFTIKYPRVADLLAIGKVAAFRRNYEPLEAFDAETEMVNMMASTLDVVVVSGPKWFEEAKTRNKNFSFLEVPSRAFISELYGKAYLFREEVESQLNQERGGDDKPVPSQTGNDGAVGGGAFEGLSSEQGNTKPK
jgi:hypothetical protein